MSEEMDGLPSHQSETVSLMRMEPSDASVSDEFTIFDEENPRSLISIVWEEMKVQMRWAREKMPELFTLTERQLKRRLDPDPVEARIRLRFWDEYARAQDKGRRLFLADCIRGICSNDYWKYNIHGRPEKIAWIITPPVDYITNMQELLYLGLEEFREILTLPIVNDMGKADSRLIAQKVKIVELLDARVKGAVVQKIAIKQQIDQRTQHMLSDGEPLARLPDGDLASIETQIARVERQIGQAQKRVTETVDVVEVSHPVVDVEDLQAHLQTLEDYPK